MLYLYMYEAYGPMAHSHIADTYWYITQNSVAQLAHFKVGAAMIQSSPRQTVELISLTFGILHEPTIPTNPTYYSTLFDTGHIICEHCVLFSVVQLVACDGSTATAVEEWNNPRTRHLQGDNYPWSYVFLANMIWSILSTKSNPETIDHWPWTLVSGWPIQLVNQTEKAVICDCIRSFSQYVGWSSHSNTKNIINPKSTTENNTNHNHIYEHSPT